MCGILGGVSFEGDFFPVQQELKEGSHFLTYRGPDDQGELLLETSRSKVSLAHRRLSIIDLSAKGHQPMISSSGRTIIVFNGEIYNYHLLRKELALQGYYFKSNSDTEVILNGFECWGIEKTLRKLDGMFSFALFDKQDDFLFLARDPFGKKPLYYLVDNNKIAFSSDIRSFKKITGISLTLNLHALGYFFAELSTPHEQTIWREVKKVKPGSFLRFGDGGISTYKTYWQLNYTEDCALDRHEIIEKTEFLLNESVKKRLVADVRVSALLSGGIDSSLVVAKMAENTTGRVKTYSIGFKEELFNELPYARQVAGKFNTDHTELIINPKDLDNVRQLILEYGEPFADSSMIPTYLMSREISRNEKVVLGGDGGDELFAGYYAYYFANKYDKVKQFGFAGPFAEMLHKVYPTYRTDLLTKLLLQAQYPPYTLLNRNFGFSENDLKSLFPDPCFVKALNNEHEYVWKEFSPHSRNDLINLLSASLKTRLLNDYLVKVDRASMYASLEMRTPFLDKDLAEFAATLKPQQLFHRTGTKSILKEISERYFSKEFTHRSKMGFGVPLGDWFRGDLINDLKEVLLGEKQKLVDFNYAFIEKVIDEHNHGEIDHTHRLWALYVFHVWANRI